MQSPGPHLSSRTMSHGEALPFASLLPRHRSAFSAATRIRTADPQCIRSNAILTSAINSVGSNSASRCRIFRAIARANCTISPSARLKYATRSSSNSFRARVTLSCAPLLMRSHSIRMRSPASAVAVSRAFCTLRSTSSSGTPTMTGDDDSTVDAEDPCGNASISPPASWYSNGKTELHTLDKRISFIGTQVHSPLLFELARDTYHLAMGAQRVLAADRPQRIHFFLQHLHRSSRQRLIESFAQFRARALQCHGQQAALHCIGKFAQLTIIQPHKVFERKHQLSN